MLNKRVFDEILGIKDVRNDKRIDYVGGIRGYPELIKRCNEDSVAAIGMYPLGI